MPFHSSHRMMEGFLLMLQKPISCVGRLILINLPTLPSQIPGVDVPPEFPRIDERFMTSAYNYIWLNVFMPENSGGEKNMFHGLNALAQHTTLGTIQEPIFVPHHKGAEEGDGFVMALVERLKDTKVWRGSADLKAQGRRTFERTKVAFPEVGLRG